MLSASFVLAPECGLSPNLWRCGAYNGIVDAIHETFGDLAASVPKREAA
jgi:hypothetical protein